MLSSFMHLRFPFRFSNKKILQQLYIKYKEAFESSYNVIKQQKPINIGFTFFIKKNLRLNT